MTSSGSSGGCLFEARLEDLSTMNKVLNEIGNIDDQSVLIVTKDGLRLVTAGEKTFQISAFFAQTTFKRFLFNSEEPHIYFKFMLKDFIENLNLLPEDLSNEDADDSKRDFDFNRTSLEIRYKGRGEPLRFRLENKSNLFINCDIKAFMMPNVFTPMDFAEEEDMATIECDSKRLHEFVSGLDLISSEYVKLLMRQDWVPLIFSTESALLGEVELKIPKCDKEIYLSDIVVSDSSYFFNNYYRTQFIKPALDALKTSTKVKMRCGSSGLLCLEHFHGFTSLSFMMEPVEIDRT